MRTALHQIGSFATSPHRSGDGLCQPCVRVLPVTGAAVSTICGSIATDTVCATDDVAFRIDELQFDLGEGPCWDAVATRRPVLIPNLGQEHPRWPMFSTAARLTEAAAVFAFPLTIGTINVGALTLYRRTPGPLATQARYDAHELADAIAAALLWLVLPAGTATEPDDPETIWRDSPHNRREIHQATGIIVNQLHVPVDVAYARLSGHAFATSTTMAVVAHDVVTHGLLLPQVAN